MRKAKSFLVKTTKFYLPLRKVRPLARAFSKNGPHVRRPKADAGGPARVILNVFVIFLLSQFAALFLIEIGLKSLSGVQTDIFQSSAAQFAYILLAETAVIAGVVWLLRRRGLSLSFIGFGRRPQWRDLKWAVAGFFSFYGLAIIASIILVILIPGFDVDQTQDVGFNYLSGTPDYIIALIALVLIPPLGEETLMRGYLFSGLRTRMNLLPAMIITSILFGAAHLSTGISGTLWAAGVSTFILSVVLVYLREKTGALYAPILVHAANNLIAFIAQFNF